MSPTYLWLIHFKYAPLNKCGVFKSNIDVELDSKNNLQPTY